MPKTKKNCQQIPESEQPIKPEAREAMRDELITLYRGEPGAMLALIEAGYNASVYYEKHGALNLSVNAICMAEIAVDAYEALRPGMLKAEALQ